MNGPFSSKVAHLSEAEQMAEYAKAAYRAGKWYMEYREHFTAEEEARIDTLGEAFALVPLGLDVMDEFMLTAGRVMKRLKAKRS